MHPQKYNLSHFVVQLYYTNCKEKNVLNKFIAMKYCVFCEMKYLSIDEIFDKCDTSDTSELVSQLKPISTDPKEHCQHQVLVYNCWQCREANWSYTIKSSIMPEELISMVENLPFDVSSKYWSMSLLAVVFRALKVQEDNVPNLNGWLNIKSPKSYVAEDRKNITDFMKVFHNFVEDHSTIKGGMGIPCHKEQTHLHNIHGIQSSSAWLEKLDGLHNTVQSIQARIIKRLSLTTEKSIQNRKEVRNKIDNEIKKLIKSPVPEPGSLAKSLVTGNYIRGSSGPLILPFTGLDFDATITYPAYNDIANSDKVQQDRRIDSPIMARSLRLGLMKMVVRLVSEPTYILWSLNPMADIFQSFANSSEIPFLHTNTDILAMIITPILINAYIASKNSSSKTPYLHYNLPTHLFQHSIIPDQIIRKNGNMHAVYDIHKVTNK